MTDEIKPIKKKNLFSRIIGWFKGWFGKKNSSDLYYNNCPSAIKNASGEFVYAEYAEALHEKIKPKSKATNIGIIASYGAGKSSLIETYKKKYKLKRRKTITISLANFNDEMVSTKKAELLTQCAPPANTKPNTQIVNDLPKDATYHGENPCMDLEDGKIEKSILQQILYREDAKKLPHSRVARIDTRYGVKVFRICLLSFLLAAAAVFLSLISSATITFEKNIHDDMAFYFSILAVILFSALLLLLLLRSRLIRGIKLRDIEVELDPQNGTINNSPLSPLNRFIEEIIYFFQKTRCKIVFIEDLDRFGKISIFTKLRELNTMINNAVAVKQKVSFVYAIQDTMFSDKTERAKFFDYIVSLSPALTTANVCDHLIERQGDSRMKGREFDDSDFFIKKIANFIPDMRVLNNILNDYILTHNVLKLSTTTDNMSETERTGLHIKNKKLFALMVYKNLHPQDYAMLQINEGDIATVFANKHAFLSIKLNEARAEYDKARAGLNDLSNQWIADFNTLKLLVCGIIAKAQNSSYSSQITLIDNLTLDNGGFNSINTGARIGITNQLWLQKSQIDNFIKPYSLAQYEQIIRDRTREGIEKKQMEINSYAEIIEKIQRLNFAETYKSYASKKSDIDELFKGTKNDLMRLLLSDGYIAEDYMEFITKRQGVYLCDGDREIISAILAKRELPQNQSMKQPENIISELPLIYFSSNDVLFFEFARAFSASDVEYDDFKVKREAFFLHITQNIVPANKFILGFIRTAEETVKRKFIENISTRFPGFVDMLIDTAEDDIKLSVINTLIEICPITALKTLNAKKAITNYINNKERYIDFAPACGNERYISILQGLEIKLVDCSCDKSNFDILKYVLQCDSYVLSDKNIKFILGQYFAIEAEKVNFATLSCIIESGNAEMLHYVRSNIFDIAKIAYENKTLKEGQKAISELLTSTLSIEDKKKIIDKQELLFDIEAAFDNDILTYALSKNKVEPTWANITASYEKLKNVSGVITNIISPFIRQNAKVIGDSDKIDSTSELGKKLACFDFADNTFSTIVKSYDKVVTAPNEIDKDVNYASLVLNGNIVFSTASFQNVANRAFYKSVDAFATVANSECLSNVASVLQYTNNLFVNCENSSLKQTLWEKHNSGQQYHLTKPYIKAVIDAVLKEVRNGYMLAFAAVKEIISNGNADRAIREELFVRCLRNESEANIRSILPHLTEYNAILLTLATTPSLVKTKKDYNSEILVILKSKGIIKYKEKKKTLLNEAEYEFFV